MAWYKGNLHMHSYWSDGHGFPEMIADWFKQEGYQFIAFTEHDQHQVGEKWVSTDPAKGSGRSMLEGGLIEKYVARFGQDWVETRPAITPGEVAPLNEANQEIRVKPLAEYRHLVEKEGRFLVITGEEVTTRWGDVGDWARTHWINVFNTPQPVAPQYDPASSAHAMQATLDAARSMGGATDSESLVYLNHPNCSWNATAESIAAVAGLRHIEIYTALNMCSTYGDDLHSPVERLWDIALALRLTRGGDLICGLATDDCHAYSHHFEFGDTALPGRGWICVRSDELTPQHILGAIHHGDFYCSSGVTLAEIEINADELSLSIDPRPGVQYTTRFIGTRRGVDLSSQPVQDAAGVEVATTRIYSAEVGQTLHETTDLSPSYSFAGDELYVRAVVSSDVAHPNPAGPGDLERAWTQPGIPGG